MKKQTSDLQLLQGTLDVLALTALEHGEKHGYAVAQWIRERSEEEFQIDDGALYTCLHRLERKDLLAARWGISNRGRRAKFYSLTAKGQKQAASEATRLTRYAHALFRVLGRPVPETR